MKTLLYCLLYCCCSPVFSQPVVKDSARILKEVTVRGMKPLFQQQVYGTVVNVESSMLSKGSSALELLERSPGVFIDRRDNNIALNGKTGVMVMINGKAMRVSVDQVITLLAGMNANDIEKIELMTTPPAGYDAEGSAGLINIVLKKARNQGSFSITGGYGWGEKCTASFNLARGIGNTGLYAAYSYSHDKTFVDWFSTATHYVPVLGGQAASTFLSEIKPVRNSHNATVGFDTRFTPRLTAGGSFTFNSNNTIEKTVNHAVYNMDNNKQYVLDATIGGAGNWNSLLSSVYVEKKISDQQQINFDIDYLFYDNRRSTNAYSLFNDEDGNSPGMNDTLFSPYQKASSHSPIKIGVAKFDYTNQLNPSLKLESGLKGTYTRNVSVSGIESLVNGNWVSSPATVNNVVMKEGIGAGYVSLSMRVNASFNVNAGVRYEYSHTRMDEPNTKRLVTARTFGQFFPELTFSWKVKERSELQLTFTKRISRPTYNDLASFVEYTGPTGVATGNSLLKPTITNNLKLGYTYVGYSVAVLLSRDNYPIARYQMVSNAAGDLLVLSPQNVRYQNNLTLQTNLPFTIGNWWSMNYGFAGGWRKFRLEHTPQPAEKSYFGYSLNFSEQFTLPKHFSLEFAGWYNSRSYDGSKEVAGFGAINGGVKKEFSKNKGVLQLSVQDIFKTLRITSYFGAVTDEVFNLKSKVPFSTESARSPIFKITYTRSFGTGSAKTRSNAGGSADERGRILN
ncbi:MULTISPECIES: outer membrane beta-barrel family protein [Niastella]|uniref:TonB-dependent receptor family protein n=1 Tax=Niastella soli TaxID=2821487 RepID=A0ABS3YVZ0_9BACT|nr:outer membrane beta-barrel family protein [Niastella soli]MBO9202097.1 TonB-dependent receptor family protein [Niastella soli]